MFRNLLAIDPSLTCSGWALFHIRTQELLAVGKIRSLPAKVPYAERLRDLHSRISTLFQEIDGGAHDVLVCESPTTMRDPRAAMRVEQVRCTFESIGRTRGMAVPGRLHPRSVQYEVMGLRGKQIGREVVKSTAVSLVEKLYADELREMGLWSDGIALRSHQDIVDAILIGNLAAARIKSALQGGVAIDSLFSDGLHSRSRRTLKSSCA